MFSWCHNRLEITGKSVCLDVMQPWIVGTEKPLYRHAIRQAIKLFLAGCAGILKPVRAVEYAPYPMLTASGTGAQTSPTRRSSTLSSCWSRMRGSTVRRSPAWRKSGCSPALMR